MRVELCDLLSLRGLKLLDERPRRNAVIYSPHMASKKITLATIAAQIKKMDERIDRGFGAVAEDIAKLATKEQVMAVKSKLDRINSRLDSEAMQRTDLKLPRRVSELEEEVYGAGKSQHPKHLTL